MSDNGHDEHDKLDSDGDLHEGPETLENNPLVGKERPDTFSGGGSQNIDG
jgi:hypothetical protein